MYKRYSVYAAVACGTNLTIMNLVGGTTARPMVTGFILSFVTSPADVATLLQWLRTTADGTGGSSFTPIPLDSNDIAAVTAPSTGTYGSAEPTYTASSVLWGASINQRVTYRFTCAEHEEFICPKTASNGLGLRSISSGATPTCNATTYFQE